MAKETHTSNRLKLKLKLKLKLIEKNTQAHLAMRVLVFFFTFAKT